MKMELPLISEQGYPTPENLTFDITVDVEFVKIGNNGLAVGVKYAGFGKVVWVGWRINDWIYNDPTSIVLIYNK